MEVGCSGLDRDTNRDTVKMVIQIGHITDEKVVAPVSLILNNGIIMVGERDNRDSSGSCY